MGCVRWNDIPHAQYCNAADAVIVQLHTRARLDARLVNMLNSADLQSSAASSNSLPGIKPSPLQTSQTEVLLLLLVSVMPLSCQMSLMLPAAA